MRDAGKGIADSVGMPHAIIASPKADSPIRGDAGPVEIDVRFSKFQGEQATFQADWEGAGPIFGHYGPLELGVHPSSFQFPIELPAGYTGPVDLRVMVFCDGCDAEPAHVRFYVVPSPRLPGKRLFQNPPTIFR